MGSGFGDIRFSGAKRAPVLFCLDVTGSMTNPVFVRDGEQKSRMQMANEMIRHFIKYILSVRKASDAVDVAFVLFTHEVVMETDFVNIKQISDQMFRSAKKTDGCGNWELVPVKVRIQGDTDEITGDVPVFCVSRYDKGTKIDSAVLYSYQKILRQKEQYERTKQQYYAPHFILVTDGDPDDMARNRERDTKETHDKAKNLVFDHAYTGSDGKNLIVPITVGIFDDKVDRDAEERVSDYGENFKSGYFRVRDTSAVSGFKEAGEFLCKTLTKSLSLTVQNMGSRNTQNGDARAGKGKSVEEVYGE